MGAIFADKVEATCPNGAIVGDIQEFELRVGMYNYLYLYERDTFHRWLTYWYPSKKVSAFLRGLGPDWHPRGLATLPKFEEMKRFTKMWSKDGNYPTIREGEIIICYNRELPPIILSDDRAGFGVPVSGAAAQPAEGELPTNKRSRPMRENPTPLVKMFLL